MDKMLLRDPSYNPLLTPIPETEKSTKPSLRVNVTISIVDIVEINELAETFTIKFGFQRDWFDHRLTYLNLKVSFGVCGLVEECNLLQEPRLGLNDLTLDEASTLWFPEVGVDHTQMHLFHQVDIELTLTLS